MAIFRYEPGNTPVVVGNAAVGPIPLVNLTDVSPDCEVWENRALETGDSDCRRAGHACPGSQKVKADAAILKMRWERDGES
jgi:hypothetical protein